LLTLNQQVLAHHQSSRQATRELRT